MAHGERQHDRTTMESLAVLCINPYISSLCNNNTTAVPFLAPSPNDWTTNVPFPLLFLSAVDSIFHQLIGFTH